MKQLAIEASRRSVVPTGVEFRWTAHHVKEIYVLLLPSKYVLDGSEKVQITCGPRDDDEPTYWQVLGSSNIYLERFDFQSYATASAHERERTILGVIEEGLSAIATRCGVTTDPLLETSRAVERAEFRMTTEVKRLGCRVGDKRIRVMRSLSAKEGECWKVVVFGPKREVLLETQLGQCPHYLDMRSVFRTSEIDDNEFVVLNRFGTKVASVTLGDSVQ